MPNKEWTPDDWYRRARGLVGEVVKQLDKEGINTPRLEDIKYFTLRCGKHNRTIEMVVQTAIYTHLKDKFREHSPGDWAERGFHEWSTTPNEELSECMKEKDSDFVNGLTWTVLLSSGLGRLFGQVG